uniref:Uncharacterized protein n=1 Tax=Tanacetum cinerariifolium TaxID=118510 RepID=A0A6L2NQB2_TANCI|nr:hypothetical protein [Tanacetum cinerariifolium]
MSSLFADTHNVVAILEKSDAAEGFKQIIDFLSGIYIHYALTVSPHIYISCINQFWNTASVKLSGDVTRLHALVDKKKIVIFEAVIREILQLNDAEGVVCLPNEEIFAEGLGKSSQGLRHLFLRACLLLDNLQKKDWAHNTFKLMLLLLLLLRKMLLKMFLMMLFHHLHLMTFHLLHKHHLHLLNNNKRVENLETTNAAQKSEIVQLKERVKKLEKANKIKSLKLKRLRKVGTSKRVESSDDMEDVFNKGRMIDDMDMNKGIELVKDAEVAESEGRHAEKQVEIYNLDLDHSSKVLSMHEHDSEVQEVVEIMTTAKLITEVVTAATATSQVSATSTTIPAASATIPAAKPTIPAAVQTVGAAYIRRRKGVIIRDPEEELSLKTPAETTKVKDKGKGILVETPKPLKKKDQIKMDAEYAKKLHEEIDRDHDGFNKDIDWDAAMDHVNQKSSNPQYIKRYQGMKKRPQTESQARKNMMIYLKNTAGYKMDFFMGMTYAQICPIFQARFDENISKVPVVDYQIVLIDNKPRFKIIRADETHQFYISFATLLKNLDREDLKTLWRIMKDRFSTSKPTNFLDEYLLLILRTMFKEPDGQDAIWKNQKSVHGLALVKRWKLLASCGVHVITLSTVQLFLLVERMHPLSRFTLEQLVNMTRL